jgi:hypothetical protein
MLKLPTKMSAGFGLSMLDRAVKESFAARCSAGDLQPIREYFSSQGVLGCFYCGQPEPKRWDHLHAVSRGGDTVAGNLVPACSRCDDSKQSRDVEEWAASTSAHRPAAEKLPDILARIRAYRTHFGYVPVEFEAKLSAEQLGRYRRFRDGIEALRAQLVSESLLKPSRQASKKKVRKGEEVA